MNIYHSYFRFWRNFPDKSRFTWVAITKTIPSDYIGCFYKRLAPIGKEFEPTINPVFNEKKFFEVYVKMLSRLDRTEVINEIKDFSKKRKRHRTSKLGRYDEIIRRESCLCVDV
jgi:hypothetical protein